MPVTSRVFVRLTTEPFIEGLGGMRYCQRDHVRRRLRSKTLSTGPGSRLRQRPDKQGGRGGNPPGQGSDPARRPDPSLGSHRRRLFRRRPPRTRERVPDRGEPARRQRERGGHEDDSGAAASLSHGTLKECCSLRVPPARPIAHRAARRRAAIGSVQARMSRTGDAVKRLRSLR